MLNRKRSRPWQGRSFFGCLSFREIAAPTLLSAMPPQEHPCSTY
ncbi:hypothetical protein B8V81_2630 [Paenibacillus pasadenensis]|uniref:Uncharacterized protein n=1 Tax=Paenibacillus pasadenensis TaxID=217090 RepID=A0A2N5N1I7_9BACL|nr:hypothetical protein B8V81_2630 [Paenibacillus pasadenensis]